MEKPKSERGDSAATGDDDAATAPSPDRSPADSGSLGDASSSRSTAPPQPSVQHAASSAFAFDAPAIPDPDAIVLTKFGRGCRGGGADLAEHAFVSPTSGVSMVSGPCLATPPAVEKPESEPGDCAAAGAGHAAPSPTPTPSLRKRLCIGSSTDRTAPTSCLHAARAAADSQFVEKTGDVGESTATAAGDTLPSPTPPPTPRRVVGSTLGAVSSSHAPEHLSEQHAASAHAFINPSLLSSPGKGKSRHNETGNSDISNGKSAPSTSTMFPCGEDGWKEGHPTATVANDNPDEEWNTLIAKWNRFKGQACEVEREEWGSMWLVDCIANQRRLLEYKEEELKQVAEEQQQKENVLEDKEEELNRVAQEQQKKGNVLEDKEEELKRVAEEQRQKEDALLLERLLLRERRMKQEEEEEARARRINNRRLPRSNSDEGFMGGLGTAYYADHVIRVPAVNGANARPDLLLPLLQHGQIPASTPVPAGIPSSSPTLVPTTAKPKAEDDMWNKRQLGYIFYLGLAVGLVFLLRPLLPDGYDRFLLAGFAVVWGLGSIGLPLGIFGTTRLEKNISRHIGRFISLCFSDMVIYAIYCLAVLTKDVPSAAKAHPSPSPPPIPGLTLGLWEFIFGGIAFLVTLGHAISWITGYHTGGDRDLEP